MHSESYACIVQACVYVHGVMYAVRLVRLVSQLLFPGKLLGTCQQFLGIVIVLKKGWEGVLLSQHSIFQPVLKHGPRSLTCVQVNE